MVKGVGASGLGCCDGTLIRLSWDSSLDQALLVVGHMLGDRDDPHQM